MCEREGERARATVADKDARMLTMTATTTTMTTKTIAKLCFCLLGCGFYAINIALCAGAIAMQTYKSTICMWAFIAINGLSASAIAHTQPRCERSARLFGAFSSHFPIHLLNIRVHSATTATATTNQLTVPCMCVT